MNAAYALAVISLLRVSWSLRLSDTEDDLIDGADDAFEERNLLQEASVARHNIPADWWKYEEKSKKTCRDHLTATSIFHAEKPRPVAEPKAALYAVLVQTRDHQKAEDMVADGLAMFASSQKSGQTLEMHLIAANLAASDTKRFENAGVVVHNFTDKIEEAKSWYRPVYNRKGADAEGRIFVDGIPVQTRKDGWATYFKFFAWASDFDVVLFADLDSKFHENNDALVHAVANSELPLITCPESGFKGYLGFNSHRMILRPSKAVFDQIVRKASAGDYVPFTNTEQDVLECYFDVKNSFEATGGQRLC